MTETAGWGVPGWLPPAVQRRVAREDAREALESKRAGAEREVLAEERHQRALALYREQAEERGQVVDVLDLAAGRVRGRTLDDIFASAVAASDIEDRKAEARAYREGQGDPAQLTHVEVGEPQLLAARSAAGLKISNRARRFRAVLDARRAADEARAALEEQMPQLREPPWWRGRESRRSDPGIIRAAASAISPASSSAWLRYR